MPKTYSLKLQPPTVGIGANGREDERRQRVFRSTAFFSQIKKAICGRHEKPILHDDIMLAHYRSSVADAMESTDA
jgi:hypothetical protein